MSDCDLHGADYSESFVDAPFRNLQAFSIEIDAVGMFPSNVLRHPCRTFPTLGLER